jgi:TetR/AcrR family transcriptional regulator, transcriptional repressor for nem operon
MARPRQFSEEQVVLAAREQFWSSGYAGTSLEDLMRVTGLGKGSLYAAFGDKHQLFLRAVREYADTSVAGLRERLATTPRALDALTAFVLAPVGDPRDIRRGCLMANSTCELATVDDDLRTEAQRMYDLVTTEVAVCVRRAVSEGDLPEGTDPATFARTLLTAQQGLTYMGRTGLDVTALATTAETLVSHLLPRR